MLSRGQTAALATRALLQCYEMDLDNLSATHSSYIESSVLSSAVLCLRRFCAQDASEFAWLIGLLCACRVKQPKDSPQLSCMIGHLLFPAFTGIRANLLASYMVLHATFLSAASVSSIAVATLTHFGYLPTKVIAELVDFTRGDLGGDLAGKRHVVHSNFTQVDERKVLLLSPQSTGLQTSRGIAFLFEYHKYYPRVSCVMLKARTSYMRASSEIAIPSTLARYSYIFPKPSTYPSFTHPNLSASFLDMICPESFISLP